PWPPERGRAVLLEASELGTALAAAQQGLCLALPEALAPPSLARVGASWSVPVLALTRETVPGAERQERVQRAVEALMASLAPS
ncbi:MAG: hypothetical protein KC635_10845, partial [Myxococcales bacterium]|nr:hypothetical protein [Myxococcales bacterium]